MMTPDDCTEHCRQFLVELDALCARYQVRLTASGEDLLRAWLHDLDLIVGETMDHGMNTEPAHDDA